MRKTLPHFIGIGGVYTGWQNILPFLASHPAIDSNIVNTNFFSLAVITAEEIEMYVSQFSGKGQLLVGECSPSYLTHKFVPSRIVQSCSETKLIAIISHPLQRLVAEWKHMESGKQKPLRCYDFALKNKHALERGRYGEALTRYFSYYSPLQLHVIVYEDFITNPLLVIRNLYEFLEVNKEYIPLPLKAYAPAEEEPKRKPFIVKRIIMFLPKWYKKYRDKKAQIKIMPPAPLHKFFSPEEKAELMKYYNDDIEITSMLLERNLAASWE